MRVELPQVLSVLAHELRSPLGVIQGYVRLLQRQHGEGDPDAPLLAAIIEQTSRISALGRQSTDLARLFDERHPRSDYVTLSALLANVVSRTAEGSTDVAMAAELAETRLRTFDAALLAAACATLVEFVVRDSGGPARLTAMADPAGGHVTLAIVGARAQAPDAGVDGGSHPITFDRGGQGLALIIASYIFDADGTEVLAARPGVVQIRLQKDRGTA